jgi:acyl carrier protein
MTPTIDHIRRALIDSILAVAPEADLATIRADRPVRDQIDIDSFDFLTILEHLHARLGIDVPESDYGRMTTLDASVAYLAQRLAAA